MPRPWACGLTVKATKRPASNILSLLPIMKRGFTSLSLLLLIACGPCWGQRPGKVRASASRSSTRLPTAPDDDFPGQVRAEFVASMPPPPAAPRAAPTATPVLRAAPAPLSPELEQLAYLKQKLNLGMPLEPDERLYLLMWMQQHPRKPKQAATK